MTWETSMWQSSVKVREAMMALDAPWCGGLRWLMRSVADRRGVGRFVSRNIQKLSILNLLSRIFRVERGHISFFFLGGYFSGYKKPGISCGFPPWIIQWTLALEHIPSTWCSPPNKLAVLGPTSVGRPEIWEQLKVLPLLLILVVVWQYVILWSPVLQYSYYNNNNNYFHY